MRHEINELGIRVFVSRRNLLALLAKLDGYPAGSSKTIVRDGLQVTAEEDTEHYKERKPGKMHGETEKQIKLYNDLREGAETW